MYFFCLGLWGHDRSAISNNEALQWDHSNRSPLLKHSTVRSYDPTKTKISTINDGKMVQLTTNIRCHNMGQQKHLETANLHQSRLVSRKFKPASQPQFC